MSNSLTKQEMLEALLHSSNENVAQVCNRILNDPGFDKDFYERTCGSFMKLVLAGDYYGAMSKADSQNKRTLESAFITKFVSKYQRPKV